MTAGELMVAQRVETREELSFDEIFESYNERIYNCIYRLVGNPEEAHDLTQETFLRAYAGLPKIDGELKVGDQFQAGPDRHAPVVTVRAIEGDDVLLDGNHPLAGVDLTFEVEIVGAREATESELSHGHAHGDCGCGG